MLEFQYIVEPSGAAGVAALKQCGEEFRKVVVVVTGRNISWSRLTSLIGDTTNIIHSLED